MVRISVRKRRRQKAGDAPHEGLLEGRKAGGLGVWGFGVQVFRCLGLWGLGFRV